VAQTTPDRAKSRNASAFSPHVEPHNDGIIHDPEIKAEALDPEPKGAPRLIRSRFSAAVSDVATVEDVPDLATEKAKRHLK
jgi:hypothetical protein